VDQRSCSSSAAPRCGRIGKVIRFLLLFILTGVIGWFIGILQENHRMSSISYAARALESTGLPAEYAPNFSLHGYTGFRDSHMQTEFMLDYSNDCQTILSMISETDHWHIAPVTASEYSDFASNIMWGYNNSRLLDDDIVFDAWYYRETTEPHAPDNRVAKGPMEQIGPYAGRGFEFALFDADTGLFIYIDQFG